MSARAANRLWAATCLPEARRFRRAATRPAESQADLLMRTLARNRETEYGRRYGFGSIRSPEAFQARVPLTTYADYSDAILRIGDGERGVLTAEPVRLFELSSGSTAASKWIPYTGSVRAEFQRGIRPWIHDLFSGLPELRDGPAYWSISPLPDGPRRSPGGIPIGFDSDSAYLGLVGRRLAETVMAVPDAVKAIRDIDAFRYATLLHLLRRPDLRLISVWNPTFLSLLLEPLDDWWGRLLADLAEGAAPGGDPALRVPADPDRARALRSLSPGDLQAVWPKLQLVSCWTDGPAGPYARSLAELFPRARIQGKGLIATEAFVSLPLLGVEGGVLAVNSHFFEFLDDGGEARLAHQVEAGGTYSVVVTTGGGLYRYRLHDLVQVVGRWGRLPCLRFLGKEDHISDYFGEKLEARFVAGVLEELFAGDAAQPAFTLLAPDDGDGFRYVLFVEGGGSRPDTEGRLDAALRANFHYDYCRRLGQLQAPRVVEVQDGAASYLQALQARGQKLGDAKPAVLQTTTGWTACFKAGTEPVR